MRQMRTVFCECLQLPLLAVERAVESQGRSLWPSLILDVDVGVEVGVGVGVE